MNEQLVKVDELRAEVTPVVQRATEMVIVTPADYTLAAQGLKDIKAALKKVDAFFDPGIESARKTWKLTLAQKATLADPLEKAEGIYKDKQLAWTKETERVRKAEEDRLNAIERERARKEREKAEAEARRQRQIEEDARRLAEENRRKAEKAKGEERARLEAEANKADRAANAAQAKAEAKTEAAAAVQANSVTVASVAPEVKGQSIRAVWKARVVDAAKVPREWMVVNQSALDAFARSTKGAVAVMGVEMYAKNVLASTGR